MDKVVCEERMGKSIQILINFVRCNQRNSDLHSVPVSYVHLPPEKGACSSIRIIQS